MRCVYCKLLSSTGTRRQCMLLARNNYDFEKINILEYASGVRGDRVIKKHTLCTLS